MKPYAKKEYARHSALIDVAVDAPMDGWGFRLTSDLDKAHAYQCYHAQELSNMGSTSVDSNFIAGRLQGADKLASAFGITLKGFVTLMYLYPEYSEPMLPVLFSDIFGNQKIVDSLRKRELRGTFGHHESIFK